MTLASQIAHHCQIRLTSLAALVSLRGVRFVVPLADWTRAEAWAQTQPEVTWSTPTDLIASDALGMVLRQAGRFALPGATALEPGNARAGDDLVGLLAGLDLPESVVRYTRWATPVEMSLLSVAS